MGKVGRRRLGVGNFKKKKKGSEQARSSTHTTAKTGKKNRKGKNIQHLPVAHPLKNQERYLRESPGKGKKKREKAKKLKEFSTKTLQGKKSTIPKRPKKEVT